MPIHSRPYNPDGPDFAAMWHLVQGDYARRQDNFVWLVSRFGDWKYGCWREAKYFPMFFRRNAQLWLDGLDAVNGFVLSEDGENVFFIFTRQGYDHLLGFIDRLNNISEIERVCTHMDHRRRGYACAAIRGCFQRLHARGYTRAYITGYSGEANGLYEKLGPENRTRWLRYQLGRP